MNKMTCTISSRYQFSADFDKTDKESVREAFRQFVNFFSDYRNSHSISARLWRFPVLYIDGKPFGKVTPNGSIDLVKES